MQKRKSNLNMRFCSNCGSIDLTHAPIQVMGISGDQGIVYGCKSCGAIIMPLEGTAEFIKKYRAKLKTNPKKKTITKTPKKKR
jgi:DNA-directed RNA polymerase subunit M/transcription elongation factor TFIIS